MDDNNKYCTNKFQNIYWIITFSHESKIIIIKQLRINLQIDNHKERGDPAGDAELNEMILDEAFGGGTAETEDNHILEIAQKASKYPTAGKIDIACAHSFDNFWRHSIPKFRSTLI